MKRLVYAPKVRAFVRASNKKDAQGRPSIIDVSQDIVSGSVTRNDRGASSAELTLRNRKRKYSVNGGSPVFLPMDMITIFMERIAGKPIQVFTGYLDSVPFFQMYPGNCKLMATCTLKRLAYQWFDPGLKFFRDFLQREGWTPGNDGSARNSVGLFLDNQSGVSPGKSDAGFGQLLYDFMIEIAGWDPSDVLVSKLPADLMKRLKAMLTESGVEGSVDSDVDALAAIMEILATTDVTPRDPNPNTGEEEKATRTKLFSIISDIKKKAGELNTPPIILTYAAILLSSVDANYAKYTSDTSSGLGLYALRPEGWQAMIDEKKKDSNFIDLEDAQPVVFNGKTFTRGQLNDPLIATEIACISMAMRSRSRAQLRSALDEVRSKGDKALASIHYAAEYGIRGGGDTGVTDERKQEILAMAKAYLSAESLDDVVFDEMAPPTSFSLQRITKDDPRLTALLSEAEKQFTASSAVVGTPYGAVTVDAPGISDNLATLLFFLKTRYSGVTLTQAITKNALVVSAPESSHENLTKILRSNPEIAEIRYKDKEGEPHLFQKGEEITVGRGKMPKKGLVSIKLIKNPTFQNWRTETQQEREEQAASGTTDSVAANGATFENLSRIAGNAAFAEQFAFPANIIESQLLTGEKALMNDMSCLDAVEQFCQASLRTYMSLPDGRFCAFYPDYFGANRKAYWPIMDIEIINMGIQLNDIALATHVYTPGQTATQIKMDQTFQDTIYSVGVATVFMKDILNSFIAPGLIGSETGQIDPQAFIEQFGVRVHRQDMPLIKNPAYEFLMAWQTFMRLWADTFQTNVEFTFQPEVMAGGIISFPEHNLQMYVKSVTHQFDYSSGFSTSADLVAPSVTGDAKETGKYPGMVMANRVTTVGAAG